MTIEITARYNVTAIVEKPETFVSKLNAIKWIIKAAGENTISIDACHDIDQWIYFAKKQFNSDQLETSVKSDN